MQPLQIIYASAWVDELEKRTNRRNLRARWGGGGRQCLLFHPFSKTFPSCISHLLSHVFSHSPLPRGLTVGHTQDKKREGLQIKQALTHHRVQVTGFLWRASPGWVGEEKATRIARGSVGVISQLWAPPRIYIQLKTCPIQDLMALCFLSAYMEK